MYVCVCLRVYTCRRMVPVAFFNSDTAWLWAISSVDVSQIDMILSPTCFTEAMRERKTDQ